jgi:hypothetical protein
MTPKKNKKLFKKFSTNFCDFRDINTAKDEKYMIQ